MTDPTTPTVFRNTATFALCIALAVAPARAQQADKTDGPAAQSAEKLTEWPRLKKTQQDKVRAICKQFRKKDEKLHAPAADKLVAIGAGAAPILIKLVNDRQDNSNEHLFAVLDRIADERHAALLAREAERHSVHLRRYLMKRFSHFADKSLLPVVKKAAQDKDVDVQFYASLTMLALRDKNGLEPVLLAARQRWQQVRGDTATVLSKARGAETAGFVLDRIAQARPTDQMAGLRLLRYLLPKNKASALRTYLQASDFPVKREAINAARVVHGEKPLEKLASFQAIGMAKQWLDKL